jgi:hypothetical protein
MGCSRGDNLRETYQEGLPELLFCKFHDFVQFFSCVLELFDSLMVQ